ncbi:hypothetical protein Q5M85_03310 [Paraclostridium bifermentans]|nr:hypothetical protein [Paraclostridium bifermentans]
MLFVQMILINLKNTLKKLKIAIKSNLTDELSNFYYSLSRMNLRYKGNMCDSIDLMKKAIKLESTDKTKNGRI